MEEKEMTVTMCKLDGHPAVRLKLTGIEEELGPILVSDDEAKSLTDWVTGVVTRFSQQQGKR